LYSQQARVKKVDITWYISKAIPAQPILRFLLPAFPQGEQKEKVSI
jgi:hypothetical protein